MVQNEPDRISSEHKHGAKKKRLCLQDISIGKYSTIVKYLIEQNRKTKTMSIYMETYKNWLKNAILAGL